MADIATKAIQDTIAELTGTKTEEGSLTIRPFARRLLDARIALVTQKYEALVGLGAGRGLPKELEEGFIKEYNEAKDSAISAIEGSEEFRNLRYQKSYEALKNASKGEISWSELFTEIYTDDYELNEIFVRLVEEQDGIEITSAKQLQKVTGITEIRSYWKGEESIEYPDTKEGKKQAQAQAKKETEECFTLAMEFRYRNLLECMLKTGAKYKDLLSIEPGKFYLPKEKQEEIIKMTLTLYYNLMEPSFFRPDLKTIAEEIEAPYGVLLEAANFLWRDKESNGEQ